MELVLLERLVDAQHLAAVTCSANVLSDAQADPEARFTVQHRRHRPLNVIRRHYTDVVLVAVVALCTLENDVIHAGYFALALLFFRRRDELRLQRNR